jgi:hypothetical protein
MMLGSADAKGGVRLIDFYDIKIAAGDLSDYLIRFASFVRRRSTATKVPEQLKGAYQLKGGYHVPFHHNFNRRHYRHGAC